MNKWELARYLIDAKKNIDSILFIAENIEKINNLDIRRRVDSIRRDFYISCCVVLDKCFPKKEKKEICKNNIIESIYYERDKNFAHKDEKYEAKKYNSLDEMIDDMKKQISEVLHICSKDLPTNLTLDYVPHDKELFRLLFGITSDKEESIKKNKYPEYGMSFDESSETVIKKIFQDTEDFRSIEDSSEYAVFVENGVNWYEGLQNRQDFCIKTNVLYDKDMWCTPNMEIINKMSKLKELGLFDEFCTPILPDFDDEELWKQVEEILNN